MARILVVEDEPMILDFYKTALGAEGYTVDCAQNGSEALQLANENKPDLLITDFMLPGMKGDEVSERLFTKFPQLAIVMITSSQAPPNYPHPIMKKPISAALLIATAKYWLLQ